MSGPRCRRRSRRRRSERCRQKLLALDELAARGLPQRLAAQAVAVHPTTVRRWQRRRRSGEPLANRRGPRRSQPTPVSRLEASALVRATHGLVGAASISHSVPSLSRRAAAQVKRETCRQIERERRARAERVEVSASGIIRGFDAMELTDIGQTRHLLVACDGRVPFRTSWCVADRYDGPTVASFLTRDMDVNGVPIVLRLDRARQHTTPEITGMLHERGVLVLQGPSHYAPYYGQLERQNREHRAWLGADRADQDLDRMMSALNARWRRNTLGWLTAAEAWAMRPLPQVDRQDLMAEVLEKAARQRRSLGPARDAQSDLAWRIAVQQALIRRGLLRIVNRGWC